LLQEPRDVADCRAVALPETANGQRATMQTPQGVDAQHGSELFPVKESCVAPRSLPAGVAGLHPRCCQPRSRNSGKTRGGRDGGRNLGWLAPVLLKSANRQRATIQSPQGLDATHRSQLFPVNDRLWASCGCTALLARPHRQVKTRICLYRACVSFRQLRTCRRMTR
jgi:hypothetical protein